MHIKYLACAMSIALFSTISISASCPVGSFETIMDSPVATGISPYTIAYSPLISSGNLFVAAVSSASNDVWVYQVNESTGALTEVPGSAFDVGTAPLYVAFSPVFNGNIYAAVSNFDDNTISVFTVNATTGFFTEIAGSPFSSQGDEPFALTYSPLLPSNKLFLATTNFADDTISIYSINQITGALNAVGSATATGSDPIDVAISPLIGTNLFLAVACNVNSNNLFVYKMDIATGALTQIGLPLTAGASPISIAFSPLVNGNLFAAVANINSSNISVYQVDTSTGVFTPIGTVSTGITGPTSITFSPLIGNYLFAAVTNGASDSVAAFQVDINTGAFSPVTGSPFTTGVGIDPNDISFSPILPGGLFASVVNEDSNTISIFKLVLVIPMITTASQVVPCNFPLTLNATIDGGTPPFTVIWSDGFTQTTNTFSVSRTVMSSATVRYQITSVTDSNGCIGVPSNVINITVLCPPTGCGIVC